MVSEETWLLKITRMLLSFYKQVIKLKKYLNLILGTYYGVIVFDWKNSTGNTFGVGAYGKNKVEFREGILK